MPLEIAAGASPIPMMSPDQATGAVFLIVGVVSLFNFALLTVWGVRRLFLERATFRPTWSFIDLWLAIQIILALLCVGMVPILFLRPDLRDSTKMMTDPWIIFPLTFLQNVAFFGVPAGFIFWKYRMPLRKIGLPPLPRRRDVLLGIGLGLAAILISQPIEAGLTALAKHFHYLPWVAAGLKSDQNLAINALIDSVTKRGLGVLLVAFLAIGPAPALGEEMLFRGFLFNLFKERFGLWPGIVLSGLIFAAIHFYFIGFLPVFFLGMALAFVYQRTGSLWTGILMHATNNGVAVLVAYFLPKLFH